MLDQRTDAFSSEFFAQAHVVVAFVGGETSQVARRNAGDLRADLRTVGPLRAAMDVDNRALCGIDEKRGLDRPYVAITALAVVTRRLSAVEVGGADGGMSRLVEQLRRESEQLSPDVHRCPVKRLTERVWTGELAALKDERGSYPLYLLGPVQHFSERCFHVKPESVQDSVLPAGNGVAGGMTDLHHRSIGNLSYYRDSLFDEAEENLVHRASSFASVQAF
jgi:hypothetical protein